MLTYLSLACRGKKNFLSLQEFFLFESSMNMSLLSPPRKGRGPSFEEIKTLFDRRCSAVILVVISPIFLEMIEMLKSYRRTDDG